MGDVPLARRVRLPANLWDMKGELAKRQWEARKFFASMTDERRAAVLFLVQDGLIHALEQLESWVPLGVRGDGDAIEVTITIQLPQLNEREAEAMLVFQRGRNDAASTLLGIERQLRGQ